MAYEVSLPFLPSDKGVRFNRAVKDIWHVERSGAFPGQAPLGGISKLGHFILRDN